MSDQINNQETTEENSNPNVSLMISGLFWAIGGAAVTFYTYQAASDGGVFIVAWGAIVFGLFDFLKGLFGMMFSDPDHSENVQGEQYPIETDNTQTQS